MKSNCVLGVLASSTQTTVGDIGEMPRAEGFAPSPGLVDFVDGLAANPHPPVRAISRLSSKF